ncbi:outer membrane protein [Terrarubrum flagellatum]|uniref:outer membrane protein n=1 Tax=Terrirubrum flagellatum TaxID=2895980 RepID=UPI0031456B12
MGALNTFALAGALVIGATAVASGADLPPPPMAYPAAPLRGSIDASGVYLRGDVGMGVMGNVKGTYQNLPATTSVTYNDGSYGNVGFAGIGIGYQFNNWFRFDVTGELRGTAKIGFRDTYSDTFGNRGTNSISGHLNTSVFLANAYVDMGNWHGFTPFLGAGVGAAYHRVSALDDIGNSLPAAGGGPFAAVGGFDGKSKTSLAWALMAGVAYDVTPNVKLELGYRYLNMGKAESGLACTLTCLPGTSVKIRDIDSHDIKLGFRWLLGGPDYAPPPIPVVVRKG